MEFKDQYGRYKLVKEGKVRRVYLDAERETVALVATDGVSAFDKKLNVRIPDKGKILTRLSGFWAQWYDEHDLGNETLCATAYYAGGGYQPSYESKCEVEPDMCQPELEGRVTEQTELIMIPVEFIVRGYNTGSLEAAIKNGATELCGAKIPAGLKPGDKLPEPMFTPTTKAPEGQHDENITEEGIVDIIMDCPEILEQIVERYELHDVSEISREDVAGIVRDIAVACMEFYMHAAWYAEGKGLIIADAKFEVGINPAPGDCEFYFGDELLTTDCARYWDKARYDANGELYSMDKQIIRDYLKLYRDANGEEPDSIPEDVIWQSRSNALLLIEKLTGDTSWPDQPFPLSNAHR